MYALGIDLGTTFTAAATWRNGHAETASLGSRAAVIPSVVLLRDDETVLTGEAASRRGLTEPQRVAREFKRRFGDTTPILLGGSPYSSEGLMAKLLRAVIDGVAEREGGQPDRICISHPANWGPYKRDLVQQVIRLANVEQPVTLTTEPEAAAAFYAHQQRIEQGAVVAVYDLGGGTFDATVLRKSAQGFEILGQPEGIERLGGIDFDAAVFNHVRIALQGKLEELDEDDPAVISAVARLREECVGAKEALSSDTDASIPVLLPNLSTEVRLTRAELEGMLRPALYSTIESLRRALRSAGVTPDQLHSVLLVGGSSRMPLVSQLVGAELGRPVAVDAHPKHAIALGAAWLAAGVRPAAPPPPLPPPPPRRTDNRGVAAFPVGAPPGGHRPPQDGSRQGGPVQHSPALTSSTSLGNFPPDEGRSSGDLTQLVSPVGSPPGGGPPKPPKAPKPPNRSSRRILAVAGGVIVTALVATAVVWAANRPGGVDNPDEAANQKTTESSAQQTQQPQKPADEQCTDEIKSNERWVCLTGARFDGDQLVVSYQAEWAGGTPSISNGFHLHIWGSDGKDPADHTMGTHADERGDWVIKDQQPAVLKATEVAEVVGAQPKVCARIANTSHALVPDSDANYVTGNCVPIKR